MPGIYDLLKKAIIEKKQIVAYYHDLPREMCPHVLGRDSETGREKCLFYQFAGESNHGLFPLTDPRARKNWRCLFLDEISEASLRDGDWYSISWHTKKQNCIDIVEVQVPGWIG